MGIDVMLWLLLTAGMLVFCTATGMSVGAYWARRRITRRMPARDAIASSPDDPSRDQG